MGRLIRFVDSPNGACWSRVDIESGEPVWISIAQNGVLVKRSRLGLFGAKLYEEQDIHKCVDVGRVLNAQIVEYSTPSGMTNLMLRAFTQVALEAASAADFCARIGKARHTRPPE